MSAQNITINPNTAQGLLRRELVSRASCYRLAFKKWRGTRIAICLLGGHPARDLRIYTGTHTVGSYEKLPSNEYMSCDG